MAVEAVELLDGRSELALAVLLGLVLLAKGGIELGDMDDEESELVIVVDSCVVVVSSVVVNSCVVDVDSSF